MNQYPMTDASRYQWEERPCYFRSYITDLMAGAFGVTMNHTLTATGIYSEGSHA